MTQPLVTGQNRPVQAQRVEVDAGCLPDTFALAVVPIGTGPDPVWRGDRPSAVPYLSADGEARVTVDLGALGPGTERVELVAFGRRGGLAMRDVPAPAFVVDGSRVSLPAEAGRLAAVVFARLYRHSGAWKVRALAEGSNANVADLGRMIGRPLDAGSPQPPAGHAGGPGAAPGGPLPGPLPSPGGGQPAWTGSGFLVAPGRIVTNAHVVKGAREILVVGFDGRSVGEPVIVDEANDLALVRVDPSLGDGALAFRSGAGVALGETAIAVGYPLAGLLGSGPQVTQGGVSGLLGPEDDARVIQVSTPIQGGSSGGPLLDAKGRVIGVVSAYLSGLGVQNVNFAVRACLAQAMVEASGRAVTLAPDGPDLDIATIARNARAAVWRLEARR